MNVVHGYSRYVNHQCRCDVCRRANTEHRAAMRRDRAARLAADPRLAKHGVSATYTNWACRCVPCRTAHVASKRRTA